MFGSSVPVEVVRDEVEVLDELKRLGIGDVPPRVVAGYLANGRQSGPVRLVTELLRGDLVQELLGRRRPSSPVCNRSGAPHGGGASVVVDDEE